MSTPTTIGAAPARVDIEATAGAPIDFTVPVLDAVGAAQSLSGWTLSGTVHTNRGVTVLHTFTVAADDGARVSADGEDTAAWADWPVSVARWSLWLTSPADAPTLHAAGWVRVHTR
jgi:hypothetical protein